MILYKKFYRFYGIRRLDQLAEPTTQPISELRAPKGSLLHYLPSSEVDEGPDKNYAFYVEESRPVRMDHVRELTSFQGNPRLLAGQIEPEIMKYFTANRKYRRLHDLSSLENNDLIQAVVNYSFVGRRYRYQKNEYVGYWSQHNLQQTFWNKASEVAQTLTRQQFIQINVPERLPSFTELQRAAKGVTKQTIKKFNTPERLVLLELWKWIVNKRDQSSLNVIEDRHLQYINLIFVDHGRWFVLNLGRFDAMRKSYEESGNELTAGSQKDPTALAKLFLRGLITLTQSRSVSGVTEESESESQDIVEDEEDQNDDIIVITDDPKGTGLTLRSQGLKLEPKTEENETDDDDYVLNDEQFAALTQKVEEDLEVLESVNADDDQEDLDDETPSTRVAPKTTKKSTTESKAEKTEPVIPAYEPPVVVPDTPEDRLMDVVGMYSDYNLLSASEVRKFEKLSTKYKELRAENGQTLDEYIKIPAESIQLKTPKSVPLEGVTDQRLVGSTLQDFDAKYIKEVLDRDVTASVLNVQKAGLAVTDFKKETVETVMGAFDSYQVRVVPVDGAPSTLMFRLPKVSEDGSFMVNGVKYRFKKQQGVHLPIKKIAPDAVSLTSYYGKVFVRRPKIRAANYGRWLVNAIKVKEFEDESSRVKNLNLMDSSNERFKAPRVFTYLSKEIGSFTTQYENETFTVSLETKDRTRVYSPNELARYEVGGSVILAKSGSSYLVMKEHGEIIRVKGAQSQSLGYIEDVLDLDARRSPVEYSQLSIMGKEVPVGFLLAYRLGLGQLLAKYSPSLRRVPLGTRVNLQPNEYAVGFSDETLVFDKRDTRSMLLFAGFTKYRNSIKAYTYEDFNQKDVYANILEENGLSVRVLNEVDLMYQLFIDPITKELLEQMKEPTEYGELLERASELLVDDYVPVVKDRIRGYERFAGVVYNELVRSIRAHNNRYSKNRQPLDFNPYSVQQTILTDPAKMQVTDINPVEDLKQVEAMSYSGMGGRSVESMTKETRRYKTEEMGLVSEATVDSHKVSVNTYSSANPKLNSLRGTYDEFDLEHDSPAQLLSSSALLSPSANKDDPKRVLSWAPFRSNSER